MERIRFDVIEQVRLAGFDLCMTLFMRTGGDYGNSPWWRWRNRERIR